jgi:hypothetical protein
MDETQVSNYLLPNEWKYCNPNQRIKPRHYRVEKRKNYSNKKRKINFYWRIRKN